MFQTVSGGIVTIVVLLLSAPFGFWAYKRSRASTTGLQFIDSTSGYVTAVIILGLTALALLAGYEFLLLALITS